MRQRTFWKISRTTKQRPGLIREHGRLFNRLTACECLPCPSSMKRRLRLSALELRDLATRLVPSPPHTFGPRLARITSSGIVDRSRGAQCLRKVIQLDHSSLLRRCNQQIDDFLASFHDHVLARSSVFGNALRHVGEPSSVQGLMHQHVWTAAARSKSRLGLPKASHRAETSPRRSKRDERHRCASSRQRQRGSRCPARCSRWRRIARTRARSPSRRTPYCFG